MSGVPYVIAGTPLRCFNQLMAAGRRAEQLGAALHITEAVLGRSTGKLPGMTSPCMGDGRGKCRHEDDFADFRALGGVDVPPDMPCWEPRGGSCRCCGSVRTWDGIEPHIPAPPEIAGECTHDFRCTRCGAEIAEGEPTG